MARWLTVVLCLCLTTSLSAQGKAKKGKNKQKNLPPVASEREDDSKVVFAFDPGSHTRPISVMGFNREQTQLITVGWDYTIQIWDPKSGERLDIIRLPAYGRDNGFDSNRWNHAAISADGAFVAIGGGPKLLYDDQGIPTRILIVDLVNRRVRKLLLPGALNSPVTCLSWSANGDRLAVGVGGEDNAVYLIDDVIALMASELNTKPEIAPTPVIQGMRREPHNLALSPTGNKLVIEDNRSLVMSWDVAGKESGAWKQLGEFNHPGQNDLLAWAPDESHFAWTWRHGEGKGSTGIQLRAPDATLIQKWAFGELSPGFGSATIPGTLSYLDADRLFISADVRLSMRSRACVGVVLDPKTGATKRNYSGDSSRQYNVIGAATSSGALAAIATHDGLDAVVFNLEDGTVVSHCGSQSPVPTIVGWSKEGQSPAIAWGDLTVRKAIQTELLDLKYAFDLTRFEPVANPVLSQFTQRQLEVGEWSLSWSKRQSKAETGELHKGENEIFDLPKSSAMTLIPTTSNGPLVAHGVHDILNGMGSYAYVRDNTGKVLVELQPAATHHRDMVASPDGRYLLLSTGTQRLSIYRTDGSRFPFLNLIQARGEWVCWTPEGYYAASPGGEKMIGWAESRGANDFPLFHSAEKFAKQFRRPDILKLAFDNGSLSKALETLNTETRGVESILPPRCELKQLKQADGRIQVMATAMSGAPDQPVIALRLLLDGRPLARGVGAKTVKPGEKAEATWDLEIPAGNHELKLQARSEDSSAVSLPLIIKGPKSATQQPVLHRLCVGVDQYALSALNLTSATKDATDVYNALEKHCVGSDNRFGGARGVLLTDKQATRTSVLNAITEIRKAAKPGDLVVFLFAGHGIKQKDEYYLLTHEGDPGQSLAGRSLSGADLRSELAEIECPVLLVMDSCYSAGGVKSFRPATDDLTRSLTDDSAGVTVLAAAMAHEVASATAENGHFTAAFLKALKLDPGVPFDTNEHLLYTHHIYSVVFSEVRKATNGKQNPFLNMPWTVPPIALRDVPH